MCMESRNLGILFSLPLSYLSSDTDWMAQDYTMKKVCLIWVNTFKCQSYMVIFPSREIILNWNFYDS